MATDLVRFVGSRQEDAALPPAVALVAADRPQQDVGLPVDCLLALLDVQRADVRAKHVVPKGHAEVRVRGTDHRAQQAGHLGLLGIRRQRVDEIARPACREDGGVVLQSEPCKNLLDECRDYSGSSPVWSMLGPVLRVGVPLDWICHLEPVSSDVQLQKDGSWAKPKSQANQRKAAKVHKSENGRSGARNPRPISHFGLF